MKKTSRLFALVLAVLLIAAGCTSKNGESTPSTQTGGDAASIASSVDTEGPLEGDVIIAVNTNDSIEELLSVGILPSDDGDYSKFEDLKVFTGIPLGSPDANLTIDNDRQVVGKKNPEKTYNVGEKKNFKTIDFYKRMMQSSGDPDFANYDVSERLDAEIEMVYAGKYCTVWGQVSPIHGRPDLSLALDEEMAKKIANEFDDKTFGIVTNTFGPLFDVDKDGKFAIVCADFVDYYNYGVYENYFLQGYCNPVDDSASVENGGNGMEMDMMVLDIWPTLYNEKGEPAEENWMVALQTVAHEMQHYANFSATNFYPIEALDSWIQESFSTLSESLYKGKVADDTFGFYKKDSSSVIANGRSPMQFQGKMEDYALVNLFSLYLYEQTKNFEGGGFEIFRKIIEDPAHDYVAIENALKGISYPVTKFSDLLFNFRVAIIANEDSGIYSFNKNENVQNLPIHFYKNADGQVDSKTLAGGAAIVFKNVEGGFKPQGNDANVKFAGITLAK
ncbi:MAG: hypothetical protein RR413_07745 [Christensenellaceae bacterium]